NAVRAEAPAFPGRATAVPVRMRCRSGSAAESRRVRSSARAGGAPCGNAGGADAAQEHRGRGRHPRQDHHYQSEEGEAVRLAGGSVYASRFASSVREGARSVSRRRSSVPEMADASTASPDASAREGEVQWAALRQVHAPLQCGPRTIRLDQPQVMGILNVTPDSFSDGGKFLDKPDAA
ncbi:hypothetical protein OY671_009347, partial [Metschnikowia pulcherrima]